MTNTNSSILGTIYSFPIPSITDRHYYVIATKMKEANKYLLLTFSSVKYEKASNNLKIEKKHDTACEFDSCDNIRDKNGKLIIKTKSYIRYQIYKEIDYDELLKRQIKGEYILCGKLPDELLERIIRGAMLSKEIKPFIKKKYFSE